MRRSTSSRPRNFGNRRPGAGRLKIVGGIVVQVLREHDEAEKAPDRGNHARNGARRQPFVHQAVDEMFQLVPAEQLDGFFLAGGEFSKPLEVAAVTFKRVIGEPPFDAQVCQIRIDEIMGG